MSIGDPSGAIARSYFEFGAQTTVDINSQKVFEGVSFAAAKRFVVPSSGVVDIVFDGTGITKDNLVFLPLSFKAFGAGPIFIDAYFGGTISADGTLVVATNRDNLSANTSGAAIRINPTVTSTGTKLPPEFVIFSDGVPATAALGGEVIDAFVTRLRTDGKYLFRLTNQEAAAADAWFGFNWFEVDTPA